MGIDDTYMNDDDKDDKARLIHQGNLTHPHTHTHTHKRDIHSRTLSRIICFNFRKSYIINPVTLCVRWSVFALIVNPNVHSIQLSLPYIYILVTYIGGMVSPFRYLIYIVLSDTQPTILVTQCRTR